MLNSAFASPKGAVTDNWPTVEPYFNETGSNCPSILPKEQQKELMELAVASVLALGFSMVLTQRDFDSLHAVLALGYGSAPALRMVCS